jgi:signal transduction histidine kinase
LNAILGYARMLRTASPRRRGRRAPEIVERNATALTQMVDVLTSSHRRRQDSLNVQPVDLPKVVEESIGTVDRRPTPRACASRRSSIRTRDRSREIPTGCNK